MSGKGGAGPAPVEESKRRTIDVFCPVWDPGPKDSYNYAEFIQDGAEYDGPDSRYNMYHVVRGQASLVVTKTCLATVNAHTAPDIMVEWPGEIMRTGRMVGPLGNHGFAFRDIDGTLSTSYPPTSESDEGDSESAEGDSDVDHSSHSDDSW